MTATVAGIHLGLDTHANRPAANTVPDGSVYSCSTHSLVYKSNYAGNSWATWATLGGTGLADQGVFTYLDGTVAAAPGTPAAGKLRLYAKTGKVLAVKDDAGVETVLGAGGGSDLVQVASGAGSVRIPGIDIADRVPASPSAYDDEFDALSGWTTLGSLSTSNVSDAASLYHLAAASATGTVNGIYKTAPSMPFTVTAKINTSYHANYTSYGILLADSTPTALLCIDFDSTPGPAFNISARQWTNRTTFSSSLSDVGLASVPYVGQGNVANGNYPMPLYIRALVTSSTSVTFYYSLTGLSGTFVTMATVNPGISFAKVGLCASVPVSTAIRTEAYFDWIRFT